MFAICWRFYVNAAPAVLSCRFEVEDLARTYRPPTPRGLLNWVQTGSKTKLIRHGSRGTDGMHDALYSLSRDGDNMNFPYTCRIAHRPHRSHRLAGRHGIDGARFGRFSCIARRKNLARNERMSPTVTMAPLAHGNNTVAICFFLDAPTTPC